MSICVKRPIETLPVLFHTINNNTINQYYCCSQETVQQSQRMVLILTAYCTNHNAKAESMISTVKML